MMLTLVVAFEALVMLALAEGALRLMGFHFNMYPERAEFGSPTPENIQYGWVADPSRLWVSPDYFDRLARVQPGGVVFMGCSCTQFGDYDRQVASLATEHHPGQSFSFVNLGMLGWTSFQGLEQLKLDVLALKPRVVTVYYGWNDHWIGFGMEDKQAYAMNHSWLNKFRRSRLVQLIQRVQAKVSGFERKEFPQRVSLEDFKSNLTRMAQLAKQNGIALVLLTAPSGHVRGQEPAYLKERWIKDLDQVVPLHEQYVQAVREVAAREGVVLCDLAGQFDERYPREQSSAVLFGRDGIHLKPEGHRIIAQMLYDCLESNGLMDQVLKPQGEVVQIPSDQPNPY